MKQTKFKITNNTDSVDIEAKAIGLHVSYDRPSDLHTNRGLHIQIRHNRDKATFKEANRVAKEVSEGIKALDLLQAGLESGVFDDAPVYKADVKSVLANAGRFKKR
jgi:hypothetical protein